MEIDYRELLIKYIQAIIEIEGVDYFGGEDVDFTDLKAVDDYLIFLNNYLK